MRLWDHGFATLVLVRSAETNLPCAAARAFTPPPKVVSAVVELVPYDTPPYPCDMTALQTVAAAAFGQRRKMLRRSLGCLGVNTAALMDGAGIDPTARAETAAVTRVRTRFAAPSIRRTTPSRTSPIAGA